MLKLAYAGLALLGLGFTWFYNLRFIESAGGFDLGAFIDACFVNFASSSITVDILIGASAFTLWMFVEARRLGMRHVWLYFVLTNFVAFAFAAPLFLLMRELKIEELNQGEG